MGSRPYTLYRTTRVAPAVRWGSVAALAALTLGPVALTALALGGRELSRTPTAQAARPAVQSTAPTRPTVEIAAVGDIALGRAGSMPERPEELFAGIRTALRADVTVGNLESALSEAGSSKCAKAAAGCFSFVVPPAAAGALRRVGFTVLNVANNHTRDAGESGLEETAAALRRSGIATTGRPDEIALLRARGLRIAVLGFAPYPWAADLLDIPAAQRLVRRADARADLVVVNMHAGGEGRAYAHVRTGSESYLGERRGDPVAFARAVVDAGADLVLGHGPHLLRATEWYRGRLIAYSLGNFSSYRNFDLSGPLGSSVVLRARLRADGSWAGGRLVPVRLEGTGTPAHDDDRTALALVRDLSRADVGRRAPRVALDGSLRPPA